MYLVISRWNSIYDHVLDHVCFYPRSSRTFSCALRYWLFVKVNPSSSPTYCSNYFGHFPKSKYIYIVSFSYIVWTELYIYLFDISDFETWFYNFNKTIELNVNELCSKVQQTAVQKAFNEKYHKHQWTIEHIEERVQVQYTTYQ